MFSSDHNIRLTRRLLRHLREYARLRYEWAQLALVDKLTVLLTCIVAGAVAGVLLALALMLFSALAVALLAPHVGGMVAALALMVLVYAALAVLVWAKRRAWIANPIANFLAHLVEDACREKPDEKKAP